VGPPAAIRYARTADGLDIAYTTYGNGPRDVVLIHGFTTHLDFVRESPWHWLWTRRLGEHFRVIELDKRGTGLSDRSLGQGSLEERVGDVVAVMDAVDARRPSIVGISEGGPMALTLAAMHPERVDRLLLYGAMARVPTAPDYPVGVPQDAAAAFVEWAESVWGTGQVFATFFITHAPDVDAAVASMARFERNACTPQMARVILRHNLQIDVRALLSAIDAPTVVMHNRNDPLIPFGVGQYVADHIPGARFLAGDGDYHCTWTTAEFEPLLDQGIAFLIGDGDGYAAAPHRTREGAPAPARALKTVLFTDIVGSTDKVAALGDERWGHLLEQHHRRTVEATRRRGGTVVKSTGDGVLALFDAPSRAIHAVLDLRRDTAALRIQLRSGIHTGEIEHTDNSDVAGIAVHIAARVMALAGPDEVLVSRTVRDLTTGSGLAFADRGTHVLRGVPGEWDLYAVTASG
jgi:class 3 adenylate cyclase/pimeloyl-ACP methyl ester carboxylesterase